MTELNPRPAPRTIDDTLDLLTGADYVADRSLATVLFRNSVFGITALVIASLNFIRPSIVLLTVGLVAACLGIVLYNIVLSGLAIGLFILGLARPAPATA